MAKLVHFELPSKDYARSKKFYEALFGWKVELLPMMNYAIISVEEGIGGGFTDEYKPATENGISLFFEVDDIPKALAKVVELGGTQVIAKMAIGGGEMGYFGKFRDPDGNIIGLWSKT